MGLTYTPGYGYSSKDVQTYQDALGQTHFSSGGVYNEDGTYAKGKLISTDGTVSNFGRNPNYDKARQMLNNNKSGGESGIIRSSAPSATDLIAKWKRGDPLSAEEIEIIRQYLMRQGYYVSVGNGDTESFNSALSGYVASQNNQQQAANSQSWGFPGGGSTTIGKNDSKSKKMTNSSNWNRATTHESDVRLRRDLRS